MDNKISTAVHTAQNRDASQPCALEVKELSLSFRMYDTGFTRRYLKVISDLNVSVDKGEILAIAGSSGSGKSLLAHAILGILPKNAHLDGEMTWFGQPLTAALQKEIRGSRLALVPQSVNYLDPLMKAGRQVSGDKQKVDEIFAKYGLEKKVKNLYPFELSGGMARRVLISTAVAVNAQVIIADEPTPGLSWELAETAMGHFRELADAGAAVLLITHDIDLAVRYADRISIFYAGSTLETAPAGDFSIIDNLRHPYTKALWAALPQNGLKPADGIQPPAWNLPAGCLFADRCPKKTPECETKAPEMRKLRGGEVKCHYAA